MKKGLLLGFFTLLASASFAQFTAGNLAIYRYGDGATAMTNGARVPVFIDEYTPAGVLVNTIPISQTANGVNYGLEGLGLKGDGTYEAEGYPVLSRDGSTLSIIGYNPAASGEFVIGTINAAATVSTTTLVVDAIGTPRSAVVEGTSVYFNGYDAGVRYKTLGTTTASTRVSTGQNAPRVLTIAETSLNGVIANKIFAPDAQTNFAFNNLVTASSTFGTLGFSGTGPTTAHQVLAFKSYASPSRTIVYVLDDNGGSPLIRKYRSNAGGSDWIALGTLNVPLGTKSLTGTITATGVTLYYVSLGEAGLTASTVYTYNDAFTAANEGSISLSGSSSAPILTAPANTTFRGVTMAPGTNVLPVTLTSFKAKEIGTAIRLNWSTASEKNSSRFDVLRSFDGKGFQKIGEVAATGNSDVAKAYSFNDENPFPGTNYYKLQQVDNDGKSSFYGPVSVNSKLEKTDFSIYASSEKSSAEVLIYSTIKQNAKISLVNIGGQVLGQQSLSLEKGYNKFTLPVSKTSVGVQIAVLNAQSQVITKKFLWQ